MSHDLKSWTEEKKSWVFVLSDLFEQMFGTNFLTYCFDKDHGTKVDDSKNVKFLNTIMSTGRSISPEKVQSHRTIPSIFVIPESILVHMPIFICNSQHINELNLILLIQLYLASTNHPRQSLTLLKCLKPKMTPPT